MESLIIFVHVIAAIGITGLVLIQHGKGADMGASFGSGASQTMFGSGGSGNALSRSTTIMAVVFFITSLGLAIIARQQADLSVQDSGLIQNLDEVPVTAPAPASTQAEDVPQIQQQPLESDAPAVNTDPDIPTLDGAGEAEAESGNETTE